MPVGLLDSFGLVRSYYRANFLFRNYNSQLLLLQWRHDSDSEDTMAARSTSDGAEGRRPPRANDKGVVDLAGDAMKEIATLVQTELQLLRAEIFEKLTFTALSAALIGGGALLLITTIVLLLEAAITGLVADGFSRPVATLIVAAVTLIAGAGLIWLGINRLSVVRLAPSKTVDQLQKDLNIANTR